MKPEPELFQIHRCVGFQPGAGGHWIIRSPIDDRQMNVVASWGLGWDHVSVSRRSKMPGWREMEYVKRLFFHHDETAMQLHLPPAEHISIHPFCLHLWRPQAVDIPRPPELMV
jgi:hypothetical protein